MASNSNFLYTFWLRVVRDRNFCFWGYGTRRFFRLRGTLTRFLKKNINSKNSKSKLFCHILTSGRICGWISESICSPARISNIVWECGVVFFSWNSFYWITYYLLLDLSLNSNVCAKCQESIYTFWICFILCGYRKFGSSVI